MTTDRPCCISALLVLGALAWMPATAQARPSLADRMHAQAVESFRSGRFPEAYGRFVSLAEVGHSASAKYALWMCEHGLELFGKDWDCAPHQIEDWSRSAGIVAPTPNPRYDPAAAAPRPAPRR